MLLTLILPLVFFLEVRVLLDFNSFIIALENAKSLSAEKKAHLVRLWHNLQNAVYSIMPGPIRPIGVESILSGMPDVVSGITEVFTKKKKNLTSENNFFIFRLGFTLGPLFIYLQLI